MPGSRKHHSPKMLSCVDQVMSKGEDESAAFAICTAQMQKIGEPIFAAASEHEVASEHLTQVHIRSCGTPARKEMYQGKEYLVVPVVALVEGVIHAVNASMPEFVPRAALMRSAHTWNGRPLVIGHPVKNGVQISANDPIVMREQSFGWIFASRAAGARLGMEAWCDPDRLRTLGQNKLLEDITNGKPIEVSVGAHVKTLVKEGLHLAKRYAAEWVEMIGDHLAFLPGGRGACSCEMGCGANRAASENTSDDVDFTFTEKDVQALWSKDEHVEPKTLRERLQGLVGKRNSASDEAHIQAAHDTLVALGATCGEPRMAAHDGKHDGKHDAKQKDCEECDGTGSKDGNPCESCDGSGSLVKRKPFKAAEKIEDSGEIESKEIESKEIESKKIGPKEVEPTTVDEMTPEELDRHLVNKASAADATFKAACSCEENDTMTTDEKTTLIKKLVEDKYSGFTTGDERILEAATPERLESFRVAAESRGVQERELRVAAERKLSPEEWKAAAPPEMLRVLERQEKQETEVKAALVTELKAAQSEYSEAELSTMAIEGLQRLARVAKVDMKVDFSGRVGRVLSKKDEGDDYTPPDPYEAGLKALQSH